MSVPEIRCPQCGNSGMLINNVRRDMTAICKRVTCGHRIHLKPHREHHAPVIPAGKDCEHVNVCRSAAEGNCYRPQFMREDYSCVVARAYEV